METKHRFTKHGWIALILFVALLLDGVLSLVLGQWLLTPQFSGVPQLTLITLLMIVLFLPEEPYVVLFAVGFGLLFDVVYTGILGITALLWPLIVYIAVQLRGFVPRSPLFVGALVVIAVTMFTVFDDMMNRLIGYGTGSLVTLISVHLGPALLVNVIGFAIVYLPLSRILINLKRS
ncbi:rod shape-determining protein MreD [Lacticaseibacillus baoqingensis]|uniref:Rod shape-determining protein MreD n=1 Tax=Lacticaseibacillus baoqingensis TaxID=2486013 RepID=A0ABW4E3G7_9LACO|nr:rod shape-determining protein MreD [Lacticaseibacillus baoqingensis]